MTFIKESFDKTGCDKSSRHSYHIMYEPLINQLIKKAKQEKRPLTILEIGIFKGNSLESYIDYLDALDLKYGYELYGIDIFTRLKPEEIPVLKHDKVFWYTADSTTTVPEWDEDKRFDLIIDDGLHTPKANYNTFNNYYPYLEKGGSYIIEDVWPWHLMTKSEKKHPWLRKSPHEYNDEQHNNLLQTLLASGGSVKEHDLRRISSIPDSFAFEIVKNWHD